MLAHKDESSTVHNKYGMAFTLDDAIQARSEKRVLLGVPGESVVVSSANTETTTTSAATPTVTAAETVNSESAAEGDSVTTVSPAKETENKDLPAEGAFLIGSDDDDKSSDENDQRIVFIERLMGLHLSSPNDSQGGPDSGNDALADGDQKKKAGDKWDNRPRKFKQPSEAGQNEAGSELQPHPMLKYAAAAMMSRLIAAAARAQMETQAREALLLRGGAKDKDDDAEEESVPVLLASLRAGEGPDGLRSMRGPASPHMYGRPMSRSARGPLGGQSQRMASMGNQRFLPAPPQVQGHPMLQQLQALQVLSALQRMQRQRDNVFQGPAEARSGPAGEKGTPALVMVAIPIQSQESRQQAQQMPAPYVHQPMAHYRSYYPYASPYSAYSAYRPIPHPHAASSYAMPMHAVPPPPPPPHHYAYRPSPYAHSAPYVSHPVPRTPALHPAYSHVRPVIEVPVEVPIPYHVPVPVAAYPAATMHAHGPHSVPAHGPAAGREDVDNSASDSDQIVLFYDAELQNDNENQESGNTDDLQSSASERRPVHSGKSHQFLASQQLPPNPSPNKLKLFREMMNQKYASQPGVRYLPISIASGDDLQPPQSPPAAPTGHIQARMFQGQESQPQPAFIVIADDRDQPQAVERRR